MWYWLLSTYLHSVQKFVGPEPFLGGFKAEHKKKDETLDWKSAFGNVVWSLQYTKAGSRIDLQTRCGYKGTITVL